MREGIKCETVCVRKCVSKRFRKGGSGGYIVCVCLCAFTFVCVCACMFVCAYVCE